MDLDLERKVKEQNKRNLRFFGTEIRILFCLVGLVLALIAWSGFKSSLEMSIPFFIMFVLSVFLIGLDHSYDVVSLTSSGLVFQRILWRRLALRRVCLVWGEVEEVTTSTYGLFHLFKATKVEGAKNQSFTVFSFMEDYLHFLRDLAREARSAHIDKLTLDLLSGRADV
jgi:hypothetical protein